MGFAGLASSEAADNRIAATDQAQVLRGRGLIVNPGGVAFTGKSGNTTYKIGKGGSVSIVSGVPGSELAGLLDNVTRASAAQIAALKESLVGSLESAQKQIGMLAKTAQQTDEEKKNKSVVWIALAALGLVALWVLNE